QVSPPKTLAAIYFLTAKYRPADRIGFRRCRETSICVYRFHRRLSCWQRRPRRAASISAISQAAVCEQWGTDAALSASPATAAHTYRLPTSAALSPLSAAKYSGSLLTGRRLSQ